MQRIVYTSQIASSPSSTFPPALDHAATETMLAESELAWTALRNGFYADSAAMFMGRDWRVGRISAPADGKVAWTAHADLAEAAATILAGARTFDGPTPPLTGSEALAALGSNLIGSQVTREILSDDAFRQRLSQRGLPDSFINISLGFYQASRRGEFGQVDSILEELIRRRPESMRDVLASDAE